ncbi:hypothetical protein ROHU_008459 [Labeo rohita]|uniref:Uncharacterized protein n=1 Tax=Labeo rohita TaxID=84645 RepID=A0A498M697_LABRO|nr:hypothetical protein ROHU_008459 [Labeo rohita]
MPGCPGGVGGCCVLPHERPYRGGPYWPAHVARPVCGNQLHRSAFLFLYGVASLGQVLLRGKCPFQVFVGRGGGPPGRPRFDPPAQAQGDQWPKARPKPKSTRGDQWEVRTGLKTCSGIPGRVRGEGGQSGTGRQGPLEVREEAAKSRYGVTSGKKAPGDLASS